MVALHRVGKYIYISLVLKMNVKNRVELVDLVDSYIVRMRGVCVYAN